MRASQILNKIRAAPNVSQETVKMHLKQLKELPLSFAIIRRLNARVIVCGLRRRSKLPEIRILCTEVLCAWTKLSDPHHPLNVKQRRVHLSATDSDKRKKVRCTPLPNRRHTPKKWRRSRSPSLISELRRLVAQGHRPPASSEYNLTDLSDLSESDVQEEPVGNITEIEEAVQQMIDTSVCQ